MNLNTIKRLAPLLVLVMSLIGTSAAGAAGSCPLTTEPCWTVGSKVDAQKPKAKARALIQPRPTADGEIWQAGNHFLR